MKRTSKNLPGMHLVLEFSKILVQMKIWAGPPAARRLFLFAGMRGWLLCMNVGSVCVTSSSLGSNGTMFGDCRSEVENNHTSPLAL